RARVARYRRGDPQGRRDYDQAERAADGEGGLGKRVLRALRRSGSPHPLSPSPFGRGGTTVGNRFPSPEGRGDQRGEDRARGTRASEGSGVGHQYPAAPPPRRGSATPTQPAAARAMAFTSVL